MHVVGDAAPTQGLHRIRDVSGELNISTDVRQANIRSAIRCGLPQVRQHALNGQQICLVGSGPSLKSTLPELRALAWQGFPLVAMNGSYEWLIRHNLKPSSMIMIDARPFNARFLTEIIPSCRYLLASQCAPETFEKVLSAPLVYLWHCLTGDDPVEKQILDDYYLQCWQPVAGGCTVGTRALVLLRLLGFQTMHVFGMDSCYLDGDGHALPQPENDQDGSAIITAAGRRFACSAWHVSQALEFMTLIDQAGHYFQLEMHGDGLLAHIVREGAADEVHAQLT